MLKVNVGLSRKLSRDYNSTGFSLNLEGEICAGMDDPETMIEKVKEFYDLAEEALNQQIERFQSESAIGSRDETQPARANGHAPPRTSKESSVNGTANSQNGNGNVNHNRLDQVPSGEAATNKQVQYLLNLGKRQGLTPLQLDGRIEALLGKKVGVYDLTKREAGDIIDGLSQTENAPAKGNGRIRTGR